MTSEQILEAFEGLERVGMHLKYISGIELDDLVYKFRTDLAVAVVRVPKDRYAELLKAEEELSALHAGGVDNWQWYSTSLEDAGFWDEEDE